jgi:Sec-independent protein translocase protein TatA
MKRIATFLLLIVLSVACSLPAQAEDTAATAENMRRAKKGTKQHQKALKKSSKKQRKSVKKYEKAQRKAAKQARHHRGT